MRSAAFLLLVILAVGVGAARWEGPQPPGEAPRTHWVRTTDGWTRADALFPALRRTPQLHPLVVASFQALASGLALAAASVSGRRQDAGPQPLRRPDRPPRFEQRGDAAREVHWGGHCDVVHRATPAHARS